MTHSLPEPNCTDQRFFGARNLVCGFAKKIVREKVSKLPNKGSNGEPAKSGRTKAGNLDKLTINIINGHCKRATVDIHKEPSLVHLYLV